MHLRRQPMAWIARRLSRTSDRAACLAARAERHAACRRCVEVDSMWGAGDTNLELVDLLLHVGGAALVGGARCPLLAHGLRSSRAACLAAACASTNIGCVRVSPAASRARSTNNQQAARHSTVVHSSRLLLMLGCGMCARRGKTRPRAMHVRCSAPSRHAHNNRRTTPTRHHAVDRDRYLRVPDPFTYLLFHWMLPP